MTYAGLSLLLLVVVPLTVYFSVKLGTYAFLRARYLFNKHMKEEEEHGS